MYRILKRLKPKYNNRKRLFGFDIETKQKDRHSHIEQEFMMGSVVGKSFVKSFWDKEEMSNFLSTSGVIKDADVFATNLDFDFRHSLHKTDFYKDFNKISIHGNIIHANRKEGNHSWKFYDTMNFTKMSVEKLGKLLNIPKLKYPECFKGEPQNEKEEKEMERYNIRDSKITYLAAEYLQDFFNQQGCKMKMTIASTGLDYWRRYGQPVDIFPEREEWIRHHYKGSFRGGRVEVIKRGSFEDIYYYDYNSHYPARCYDGVDGKGTYPNPSSAKFIEKCDEDIIRTYEGITDVSMCCPDCYIPMIGVKNTKKLLFPKGNISGWLTNIEIRRALKFGYDLLECRQGLYYTKTFIPFRKIIKTLYDQRKKLKAEGHPSEAMVKTQMNSGVFGKFCQRLDGFEEEIHIDNIHTNGSGHLGYYKNTKFIPIDEWIQRDDCFFIKKKSDKIPLFTLPILSSYTTAMGRIKLSEDMIRHEKCLIYTDTDSMFLTKKKYNSSTELGELKLECTVPHATFIRPKMYRFFDREANKECFKTKGIGKGVGDRGAWDKLLEKGYAPQERFTKFKESAVRKIPYSSIIKFDKRVGFEDDKRQWLYKFNPRKVEDSMPITIS